MHQINRKDLVVIIHVIVVADQTTVVIFRGDICITNRKRKEIENALRNSKGNFLH